jgi:hypothetical protein
MKKTKLLVNTITLRKGHWNNSEFATAASSNAQIFSEQSIDLRSGGTCSYREVTETKTTTVTRTGDGVWTYSANDNDSEVKITIKVPLIAVCRQAITRSLPPISR